MRGSLLLASTATLVVVTVGPAARAHAVAPSCPSSASAASSLITAVPWPQQRYDFSRVSALSNGAGVVVAVIDSGVDATHPQLVGGVLAGRDLLDGDSGASRGTTGDVPGGTDCVSHGTAVASIIAARPVSGVAFRGLAPQAKVLPIRVSERQVMDGGAAAGRSVSASGLAEAIRYAVAHAAKVINLSVVLYRDDPAVRAAVRAALAADVVVVAAVGNQPGPVPYPAGYDGVVGVAGIDAAGTRSPNSLAGSFVDIAAPAEKVIAAARVRGHGSYDGTSFAAPFVSATAALIRQYRPGEPAASVVRQILASADSAPGDQRAPGDQHAPGGQPAAASPSPEYGFGVLNPYRALVERVDTGLPDRAAPTTVDIRNTMDTGTTGDAGGSLAAQAPGPDADRRSSLGLAAAGVLLALVVLGLVPIVLNGQRRRWRAAD